MATVVNMLTTRNLPSGATVSPVVSIPGNLRGLYFYAEVLTTEAPESCTIALNVEFSNDGGTTWAYGGGITTTGGQHFERDGVTPVNPRFSGGLLPTGNGARARLSVILSEAARVGLQINADPLTAQAP